MIRSLFVLLLFVSGCNQDEELSCDMISMQKFRGVPMANKRFDEKCKNAKITYTAEVCQEALAELMGTNNLSEVKEEFGPLIENCFTEADLQRFHKSK